VLLRCSLLVFGVRASQVSAGSVRRRHMLTEPEAVRILRGAAIGIDAAWAEHEHFWADEPAGYYNDVTVIARHLVDSYANSNKALSRG